MKRGRRILAVALTLSLLIGQTAYAQEYMPASEATVDTVAEEYEYDEAVETEQDESAKEVESETADVQNVNEKQTETVIQESELVPVLGTSDSYQELAVGNNTVTVNEGEITITFFTPEEDGIWKIYSTGDEDTYAYLYDSEMNQLAYSDDDGENTNFELCRKMTVGETYYVGVKYYSDTNSGDITVVIEKKELPSEEELVPIKDEALENALLEECDDGDGYLTYDELAQVYWLDLSGKGITDLSGLEYAVNVNHINLSDNDVSDIDVLSSLENLNILSLQNTSVSDVSSLASLTGLETLDIRETAVTDISALEGLTSLRNLYLGNTAVPLSQRMALSGYTDMEMYAGYSFKMNSRVAGLFLDSDVLIEIVQTSDIAEIISCRNDDFLEVLALKAGTAVIRISLNGVSEELQVTVKELPEDGIVFADAALGRALLTECDINADGYISEDELKSAESLDLSEKGITDISELAKAVNLAELNLSYNNITDASPLYQLPLKKLYLYSNQLTELDLSNNTSLEVLDCSFNQLKILNISNNPLLTSLYCDENKLAALAINENASLDPEAVDMGSYQYVVGITDADGSLNLLDLSPDMDVERICNLSGAELEGTSLVNIESDNSVTYDYDCGSNFFIHITLTIERINGSVREGQNSLSVDSGDRTLSLFIPEEDGRYIFYVTRGRWASYYVYDAMLNPLNYDTIASDYVSLEMKAGKSYYIGVRLSSSSESGELTLFIDKAAVLNQGINQFSINAGETVVALFTPEEDGRYKIYSTGNSDIDGFLYDSEKKTTKHDYSSGEDDNFKIAQWLKADQTYYIGIEFGEVSESGNVTVNIEKTVKPADGEIVPIKDSVLQASLAEQVDTNDDGYVTYDELLNVKNLSLTFDDITDISGLEYAVNLESLYLYGNEITDITPLAGLSKLKVLNLTSTALTDLKPLAGLTNLERLYLDIEDVSDLSPLAELTKMTRLELQNGNVDSLLALSALENLAYLSLYGCNVLSLEGAEQLTNLTEINLRMTSGITSLSPLVGLSNLEDINLIDSDISSSVRWEMINFENRTINRGDKILLIPRGLLYEIDYTIAATEGADGISVVKDSGGASAIGYKVGKSVLHLTCGELSGDITLNIIDQSGANDIGEAVIDDVSVISADNENTAVILDSNSNLWEIYPEVHKAGENVKQYVSHFVYRIQTGDSGEDERVYRENKYTLDNSGDLWLDGEKIGSDIVRMDEWYALDSQGNLIDIINKNHPVLSDVADWIGPKGLWAVYRSNVLVLKNDGSVWKLYCSIEEDKDLQEPVMLSTDAVQLTRWDYCNYGYLKSDGSIMDSDGQCLYSPETSGSVKAIEMYNPDNGFYDSYFNGFYGSDGHFYIIKMNSFGFLVDCGNVRAADIVEKNASSGYLYYILTEDGDVLSLKINSDCSSFTVEKVASGAVRLDSKWSDYCDYQGIDGKYYRISGDGVEEKDCGFSKRVGNYDLIEEYGGKQNVLVMYGEIFMDQIVTTWSTYVSGSTKYYALRVDGTIWDITGAPKKIGTIAEDEEEVENPFVDVSESSYYYDAVLWAYDQEITTGKDATHFLPDNTCTRAQVATFLWRAKGEPEPSTTENPFVDVKTTDYYYKAVLWAYENGITTGKDATHFLPDSTVTRNQFVTFLWRAEGQPAATISNPFVDVPNGQYYTTAVLWAYENGITTGKDATHFLPANGCTRAQVAAFLYRAYH